ncbi:MAG: hypothetical protein AAF414_11835 [Pseudomonadota bacterium]
MTTDPNIDANAVFQRHKNELDITLGAPGQPLKAVVFLLIGGVIVAAMLGSAALRDWAFELTLLPIPGANLVFSAADQWHGWMEAIGVTQLFDAVHAWIEGWRLG